MLNNEIINNNIFIIINNSKSNKYKNKISNKSKIKNKGMIRIKTKEKKLNLILMKIKKYLKTKGYVPTRHNNDLLELEVSDGEVEILLKI